ncbi:Gfo/Idh/MocA family protein [Ketogulonicigenium vulgare]|uniref:Oxidoreductase, putative n=1 Tax=Ketogulonicigenium vulgare (strain WSH-001) TaxID=759362 RepID=F9YB70_KETVW|nr:Gfo/Idh/MocA family oxidoreductase [Ketogulonicigenium vulgare]ADO44098.1 oxidoreductase-like protein [Ketogulonicigenium vulgare Y25]AEM42622.1 Oxidoreductase, putative [Ketogulonicigenium vulgare WSH-001]ALJ82646.1 oxidoreductase [Ketogulonicigenium vulgare]ANW35401.1 oxidoreductase [Ketogulonicigenium vulgare]AOZ53324.1 oxidoreductase-like protein [Ketogulonicigenium vulgare]
MIGIGLVGVGMVAGIHARALEELRDIAQVRGVFDRDPLRLEAFCNQWNLPIAASFEAMLAQPDIDMLIVLTPPNARKSIVTAAAAAGKHVLMEKPVERDSAAGAELVAIAARGGITLGVVFQHRFRAASEKLRELIAGGTLGDLGIAQVNVPWWRAQSYYDEPGRGTYARDGGGVLINQAIHTLDLLQSYTGPVAEVSALMGTSKLHNMEAEDFVGAGLRFENGALGSIMATTAAFPGGAESIELGFTHAAVHLASGVLTVRYHDERVESFGEEANTGGGADPMAFPFDWHMEAQRDFITAIADGRAPRVTVAEGLLVHRLIDALVLSSREGRRVSLSELADA